MDLVVQLLCLCVFLDVVSADTAEVPEVRFALFQSNAKQAMLLNRESQKVFRDVKELLNRNRLAVTKKVTFREPLVVSLDGVLTPRNILSTLCDQLLPNHINALIFVSYDEESKIEERNAIQYLFQLISFLKIPVISWQSGGLQAPEDSMVLQMAPTLFHQAQAIFSILERYGWGQFVLIIFKTNGADLFLNAMRQERHGQFKPRILSTIQMDSQKPADLHSQLSPLVESEARVMVLFASKKAATAIFQVAGALGLTGTDYMWICAQKVIGDMTEKIWPPPPDFPVGMIGVDVEMSEYNLIKTVSVAMQIYGYGLDGLLKGRVYSPDEFRPNMSCEAADEIPEWKTGEDFYTALKDVSVPLGRSHEPRLGFEPDGTAKFAKFNITNLAAGSTKNSRIWTTVGSWDTVNGLQLRDITWPGNSPAPPRGKPDKFHLHIVTHEEDPFVIFKQPDLSGKCELRSAACKMRPENWTPNSSPNEWRNMCCTGLCIDLLERLANDVGFTYNLYHVEDGHFGAKTEDGSWNGLVGELMRKKAHLAFASLKVTQERQTVISFSSVFLETGIGIVVAKKEGAISPTAFLEPFDYVTWIVMIVACVQVVSVFIFMFEWISPYGLDRSPTRSQENRFSFFRVYWFVFAIFFGAACPVTVPRSVTAKFVATFWACCSFAFIAVYTANLATFMITREVTFDIKGIEDQRFFNPYSQQPPFRFGTMPYGSTAETIRIAYPQIFHYMNKHNRKSVRDGVDAVKTGELDAFLYDAAVLDYRVGSDQDCKILTVGSWFATTGYAIAFPQGSKFTAIFDENLLRYQRNGFLEQVQRFWLTGACKNKRAPKEGKSSHALGIKNFTSAFIFLGGGILLGLTFLILECIYTQCLNYGLCEPLLGCRVWNYVSVNISQSLTNLRLRRLRGAEVGDKHLLMIEERMAEARRRLHALEKIKKNLTEADLPGEKKADAETQNGLRKRNHVESPTSPEVLSAVMLLENETAI